jgi:rhodanese-related sulfurtransferase
MPAVQRFLLLVILAAALCFGGGIKIAEAGHDLEEPTNMVSAEQIKRLLDIGEKVIFVDLRAAPAFAQGRLPDARSIPVSELHKRWQEIPKAGRIVMYCPCPMGDRDESFAFLLLRGESYRNVSVLDGGYDEWVKQGYPVEKGTQ